jgi:hypothetical protein
MAFETLHATSWHGRSSHSFTPELWYLNCCEKKKWPKYPLDTSIRFLKQKFDMIVETSLLANVLMPFYAQLLFLVPS